MKTLNKFKRIIALGLSISMLGATLFGAHALSLNDYPKPFVLNGIPSTNLALIVGDQAAASDVVGMGDIISGLQASSISEKEIKNYLPNVDIETQGTSISNTGNFLSINESLGTVKDLFSEADLEILKGGTLSSVNGITKYNQYLKFNSTAQNTESLSVIFTEDNFLDFGDFFYVEDGDNLFDWELHFEDGFTSVTSNPARADALLSDFNFRDINILGQQYTVVSSEIDTRSAASGTNSLTSNHSIKIELLGGGVNGRLTENQEETFYFGDKPYKIKAILISSIDGTLLNVNGIDLPPMRKGQFQPLDDGLLIGMRNILENSYNIAEFTLGGNKLTFIDNDASDDTFTQPGASINGELIDEAQVKIKGKLNNKGTEFTLESINYRLRTGSTGNGIYVPPGHGVREYLTEPEGMLSSGWDIRYEGLSDTGTTTIKLHSVGTQEEYKLEFTNEEGLNYQIPAFTVGNATVRPGTGSGRYHKMLWTVESPNTQWYHISEGDYFVLSDLAIAQTPPGVKGLTASSPDHFGCVIPVRTAIVSSGANTRILQYVSANRTQPNSLTFRDLATGHKEVGLNTTGANQDFGFDIILGGNSYTGRLDRAHNPGSGSNPIGSVHRNVTIDLDGNGTISRQADANGRLTGNAWIVTQGGAILFINTTSNFSTTGNTEKPRMATGVDGGTGATLKVNGGTSTAGTSHLGNSSCLTTTILSNKFDGDQPANSRQHHLNFSIGVVAKKITGTSGNKIGLSLEQTQSTLQIDWGFRNYTEYNLTSNPTISRQLDIYGGLWEFYNPLNNESSEEFTYEFPLTQRGPKITIGGQEIEIDPLEQTTQSIFSEKINELPAGISKLASEINNIQHYNAIIIGGPCANKWAAELMNNPEPCHESIPEGEALIKLYEHANGNAALLIAGRDAIDTRKGARALQLEKIKNAGETKTAKITGLDLTNIVVKPA